MDRNPEPYDETLLGNDRPRDHSRDETTAADHDVTAAPVRDDAPLRHDSNPDVADHIGEAAGGISGVLAGAAIGSAGGPIGTVVGGIAGAIGGWWAGRALAEAATHYGDEDDLHYRQRYESAATRDADRSFDDVRPAYQLGHLASMNPDYAGRNFDDVEPDLLHGWRDDVRARHGEWSSVRGYARDAYSRGASTAASPRDASDLDVSAGGTALGDETAVTGYATGLTDEDASRSPNASERVERELRDRE